MSCQAEAALALRIFKCSTVRLATDSVVDVNVINDAHNRGVHRRHFFPDRIAGCAPFEHDEHLLVHARTDAVYRQHTRVRELVEKAEKRSWPTFSEEAVEEWLTKSRIAGA